jgi:hypothetical protein
LNNEEEDERKDVLARAQFIVMIVPIMPECSNVYNPAVKDYTIKVRC